MRTASYSTKLDEFSLYYKTFSNILTIRTISAEYLIAMKLRSGRKYKNDLSDVIGILAEHMKQNRPIRLHAIDTAVNNLYGGWSDFPKDSNEFIKMAISKGDFEQIFHAVREEEKRFKNIMLDFEKDYPFVTTESSIDDILKMLKAKQQKANK